MTDQIESGETAVLIGPMTYQIHEVTNLASGRDDGSQVPLHGCVDYGSLIIRLEKHMEDRLKMTTLWHEIVHVILEQSGRDAEVSEEAIVALGYGITAVLANNPWLGAV